jgi:hypothetical protein
VTMDVFFWVALTVLIGIWLSFANGTIWGDRTRNARGEANGKPETGSQHTIPRQKNRAGLPVQCYDWEPCKVEHLDPVSVPGAPPPMQRIPANNGTRRDTP